MLGVVHQPAAHARRRGDARGRRARWASGTRSGRRRSGVFFGGPGQTPAEHGRRPVLRRRGPRPQRLPRLRRVHDRLPAQRQEHPGQELPLPRRAGRRRGAPADDGHRGSSARAGRRLRRPASAAPRPSCRAVTATRRAHRRPGRLRRAALGTQRLLHRMKAEGHLPRLSDRLGELTRTNSESILGRDRARRLGRLHAGRGDHLVLPPRRAHPHRAGPLRQGQQRDVAAADRAHRRGRPARPRWRTWLQGAVAREAAACSTSTTCAHWSERTVIALVMQSRDNSITTFLRRNRLGRLGAHLEAGPRRAQPDLDPGGQRGRPPDGRA